MTELKIHLEGTDLLAQGEIRSAVRSIYGTVRPTDRRVAERFYSPDELAGLSEETIRIALGVGNPVRHAGLRPGDDVVDLGSGGGIDCLLAGRAVGPTGSVVGVDFLPDMVARANRAAGEAGLPNVRFVEGEIEALPLPDESADVVISNGVVNLSPRKVRVLAEAYRVLRPGGRVAIVDLVLEHDLPPEIQTHPAAWAGCLSGALSEVALSARCPRSRSTRGSGGPDSGTSRLSRSEDSASPSAPSTRCSASPSSTSCDGSCSRSATTGSRPASSSGLASRASAKSCPVDRGSNRPGHRRPCLRRDSPRSCQLDQVTERTPLDVAALRAAIRAEYAAVAGRAPSRGSISTPASGWDRVVSVDDQTVRSPAELQTALRRHAIGEEVRLRIDRDGESREIVVRHASDMP